MKLSIMALGLLWLVASQWGTALVAMAADEPVLRIESGMHIAPIVTMATDAAKRIVATGSEDKTVRLWSLPGGKPVRVLRIPVGDGSVGKIYAVAVSPDGATVAVGGWTTSSKEEQIYLLNSRTGAVIRRLTGLPDVTAALAFSSDGRFLVAGIGGRNGIIAYDAQHGWRQVATDTGYVGVVHSLAFDSTGRLATSCGDGIVRLYAAGQFDRPRIAAHIAGRPDGLAFSPDAKQLAVAFADQPKVAVLSTSNLSLLFMPNMSGLASPGGFHAVTWSASGDVLVAGGSVHIGEDRWLRRWSRGGRGSFVDLPAADDTVRNLIPLRDGNILFATMDPTIGLITPVAAVHILQGSGKLDFRAHPGSTLTADDQADVIKVDASFPPHRLSVDLRDRVIGLDDASGPHFPATTDRVPGLAITGWRDGTTPALNGTPLHLEHSETVRSLAVAPDHRTFVLGTSWRLLHFDASGHMLWSKATEGAVWNVTIAGDGRAVIAAQGDGTIRWRRLSDGAEVLALFVTPDARRWIAWTPSDFFDASPGGESLIGWQVDRGPDTAPTFNPVWQFRDRFYRPDVIARIVKTLDEAAALRGTKPQAYTASLTARAEPVAQAATIATTAPPTISIEDYPDTTISPRIVLAYDITPVPAAGSTATIAATIEGRRIETSYVKSRPGGRGEVGLLIPEDIPDKMLTVTLTASDSNGSSATAAVQVKWQGLAAQAEKPTLYILAVGINTYPNLGAAAANLNFPPKDAEDFANAMTAQKGRRYTDVKKTVLTNEQATLANIKHQLLHLKKVMDGRDHAMIFLSGHGAPPVQDWAFEPYDAVIDDENTQLLGDELNHRVSELPGITFLFLDSCFSGAAIRDHGLEAFRSPRDMNRAINVLTNSPHGVVVFSSSTGDQQSLEDPARHHGAYTQALLEGLAGKAGGPEIEMYALEAYLVRRVPELTNKKQTPTMVPSSGMPAITLAVVDEDGP